MMNDKYLRKSMGNDVMSHIHQQIKMMDEKNGKLWNDQFLV